jgi:hypothetical protein
MNALLEEMRRGMEELQLGLDGALNMSDRMEALARGIATNSVPDAWMACMSTRVQEVRCTRVDRRRGRRLARRRTGNVKDMSVSRRFFGSWLPFLSVQRIFASPACPSCSQLHARSRPWRNQSTLRARASPPFQTKVLSLAAWYADVLKRYDQLAAWTAGTVVVPNSVWLSGLFNPKAFLTAVMQTYARANKLPLDVMRFVTDVTTKTVDQVGVS